MSRRPTLARSTTLATLLALALTACSDDSGPTGPRGPSVTGIWSGTWGSATVVMVLEQSGDAVTGELRINSRAFPLDGELRDLVTFVWDTDLDPETCSAYFSRGLQLVEGGGALTGPMTRASRALPCGSSSRTHMQQAGASLSRIED